MVRTGHVFFFCAQTIKYMSFCTSSIVVCLVVLLWLVFLLCSCRSCADGSVRPQIVFPPRAEDGNGDGKIEPTEVAEVALATDAQQQQQRFFQVIETRQD